MRKLIIAIFISLIAISLFANVAHADLTSDLVLYYPMDEGTGSTIYDTTTPTVDGSITGALWTFGQFDDGLLFNGTTDNVALAGYTLTSDVYTFSVWFKKTAFSGETAIVSGTDFMFGFDGSHFLNWPDTNIAKNDFDIGSLTVELWYHLAWITNFTSGITKVYLDGNYKTSNQQNVGTQATVVHQIGSYSGTSRFFDGTLDDFRVYERELTGIEISELKALNPLSVTVAVAGSVTEVGWITFITLLSLSLVCLLLAWKSNIPIINFVFGTVTLGIAAYYLGSNMIFSGWINILAILMGTICMLSGYRTYRGS